MLLHEAADLLDSRYRAAPVHFQAAPFALGSPRDPPRGLRLLDSALAVGTPGPSRSKRPSQQRIVAPPRAVDTELA